MAGANNGLAARYYLSHRWYGQQICWSRRDPRVALERSLQRLSMRHDADRRRGGLVFRKRKRQTGALFPDAIANGVRLPLQALQSMRRTRWTEPQA